MLISKTSSICFIKIKPNNKRCYDNQSEKEILVFDTFYSDILKIEIIS